jgi:glycine C-acetyltransferase
MQKLQELWRCIPNGTRMMSGHASIHEQLENELAAFVHKICLFIKLWIQGIMSTIDALVTKRYYCL